MDEALKDERFSHILKDPRFRKIPRNIRKVKVDKRFNKMFKSKEFNDKSKLDERGRALNFTSAENLKKLYNVTNDSSEDETLVDQEVMTKDSKRKDTNVLKDSHESFKQAKGTKKKNKKGNIDVCSYEFNSDERYSIETNSSKQTSKKHLKGKVSEDLNVSKKDIKQAKKVNHASEMVPASNTNETDSDEEGCNSSSVLENVKLSKKECKNHSKKNAKNSNERTKVSKGRHEKFESLDEDESDSEDEECNSSDMNNVEFTKEKIKNSKVKNSNKRSKALKNNHKNVDELSDEDESDSENSDSSEASQESESESDDSSSDESTSHQDEFDHHWEELHEEAEDTDEITRRLAVCNMDWDRIRADDLLVCFNSFKPANSSILSVKIYPSEFGLQRMEEEKLKGPAELTEKTLEDNEEEVEDKKGSKYNREKLRQYQIKRLRYFYAVVECDTPETANHLYDQLNGMEYESSSVRFDLRFIPDDTTFDQEPTSVAEKIPDPTEYKPRLFVTTALQQVKVNLTWDETDPHRRETIQRAFTDPDSVENDIKDYLASTSGDSEDEENEASEEKIKLSTQERIAKYKELLQSLEEKDKTEKEEKYDMEITWDPSLKEKTEEIVKKKMDDTSTPFDEMLKKKKEKRKLKKQMKKEEVKEEIDSASEDSDFISGEKSEQPIKQESKRIDELYLISDAKKMDEPHEKTKSKKKKKEKKGAKMDEFKCDVLDPRFAAIYSSHDYNIDPSDPHFKKTSGTLAFIQEKQKRLLKNEDNRVTDQRKTKKMKHR